jgi:hypothetical protein
MVGRERKRRRKKVKNKGEKEKKSGNLESEVYWLQRLGGIQPILCRNDGMSHE